MLGEYSLLSESYKDFVDSIPALQAAIAARSDDDDLPLPNRIFPDSGGGLALNRLAQAVAGAERADKRLLEKPLNDLVTEIKVRGLIAKMVLVTAQQTLLALPRAEATRGLERVEAVEEPMVEPAVRTSLAKKTTPAKQPNRKMRRQEHKPVYLTHPHLPLSERLLLYEEALSPMQLAAEVGIKDRNTIYKWVRANRLPVRRAGSLLKFDQGPTSEWAKNREYLPIDQW